MKRNEKLLRFCRLLTSIIALIAAVLKFCRIWPDALNLAIPLLGVLQLLDALLYWKKDRDQAAVSLFTAGFIGLVCIGVFCM
jgi:hypothetical protein